MSSLQFMNQDGEWESYPDVDVPNEDINNDDSSKYSDYMA